MRILFWFLLLAAAAVGVALAAKVVNGYVLFVAPPYRVELSLNLMLLLVIGGFVGGYALLRLALRMAALPRDVRELRRRQREARARAKLDAAIVALLEGRYGKARQFAEESLAIPGAPGFVALVAIFKVHAPKGFFVQNGGYEYNVVLAVAALAVATIGPGALSLDHVLHLAR